MLYNLFENRDFVSVFAVALLAEGVDRNKIALTDEHNIMVALLAEGVDRNSKAYTITSSSKQVALLAEGVDRNLAGEYGDNTARRRPPRGGRG